MALVKLGGYRFGIKVVSCRKDYCNACKTEALMEELRYFLVFHFCYIPLLPLGWQREWVCARCGGDPRPAASFSPGLIIFALVPFSIYTIFFWISLFSDFSKSGKDGVMWMGCICSTLLVVGLIYLLRYNLKPLPRSPQSLAVTPLGDVCPYCQEKMAPETNNICPKCQVHVLNL